MRARGHRARRRAAVSAVAVCVAAAAHDLAIAQALTFNDVTLEAGITHTHGFVEETISTRHMVLGGVAASDYDGDGWPDLYVIRGSLGPNLLYRNRGDGTFEDVATAAGVAANGDMASGPLFFDANGDGALDLFVAGTRGTPNRLFIANGDGTFTDQISSSGLPSLFDTFSASAGDYDRDGDLDLFLAHWQVPMQASHLWRNNGQGVFRCVDDAAGLDGLGDGTYDWSFTGNFSDVNGDAWPDLLVASDFLTSRVFLNRRDGTFADATKPVITDENGMGAAVGDYDNDGDMDWFVSSIFDVNGIPRDEWGITGNRMYRNRGDGSFDDATAAAGVREGGWGWGSSFADFDNDGWLDLFHVNGWPFEVDTFLDDPARLFMNDAQGGFVESSVAAGVASTAQGRGVACFDYDRDGDIDIFIANYRAAPQLLRNDSPARSWLTLDIRAIGARVSIDAAGITQTREVACGNNYLSQNPTKLHFGLGENKTVDRIHIRWPNGAHTTLTDVAVDKELAVEQPAAPISTPRQPRIVAAVPNPFSTEVKLELEGVRAGASVTVFDVAGRRVRDLITTADAVRWDGMDSRGERAPTGVYWLRLTDGDVSDARRVILLR